MNASIQGCSDLRRPSHDKTRKDRSWRTRRLGEDGVNRKTLQKNVKDLLYRRGDNDIYTKEDAEFLLRAGALSEERIIGVETGGCPHTAIREDASINQEAVQRLAQKFPDLDIIFVESGGDNLAASFSPELVDSSIYVIDVSGGDKIPRKGGPGITKSDLLVINKIDLAPYVGANLGVMERDAKRMRGERPVLFTNLKLCEGLGAVIEWMKKDVLFIDKG